MTSCWRPNSGCRWIAPTNCAARHGAISCKRLKRACAGSTPTGSISISCTEPIRKTPIEETLRALDDLVKAGKVRFIGCSNLSAAQIEEAQSVAARHGLSSFVTCQDEYNLLDRAIEKDRLAVMEKARPRSAAVLSVGQRAVDRQIQKRRAVAGRFPPFLQRASCRRPAQRAQLEYRRETPRIRRATGSHASRTRNELARQPAICFQHHCRRHQAGTGRAERRRRRLGALAGRTAPRSIALPLNWLAKFEALGFTGRNLSRLTCQCMQHAAPPFALEIHGLSSASTVPRSTGWT